MVKSGCGRRLYAARRQPTTVSVDCFKQEELCRGQWVGKMRAWWAAQSKRETIAFMLMLSYQHLSRRNRSHNCQNLQRLASVVGALSANVAEVMLHTSSGQQGGKWAGSHRIVVVRNSVWILSEFMGVGSQH